MRIPKPERLSDHLEVMATAAENVAGFVRGMTREQFVADPRTQQAVTFNFLVLGEAAAFLSARFGAFVAKHPEVDWTGMKETRHALAHGYFQIDYDAIWTSATTQLPDLLKRMPDIQRDAIALQRGSGPGL